MNDTLPPEQVAEYLERCRVARRAAGEPAHIDDPDTLDRIASIVITALERTNNDNNK